MGAFQVKRNKHKNGVQNIYEKEKKQKKDIPNSKEERLRSGIKRWTSFYRANPHRFVEEYFGLKLKLFQKILLYMMFHSNMNVLWAARGIGKSYIVALYCICRAVLWPGTKIVLVSGTKGQSKLMVTQKIQKEMMNLYPNINREIKDVKTSGGDIEVLFHNSSSIAVVPNNDNARGYRANVLVLDEFRLILKKSYESIFQPFLNVNRQPGYLSDPKYKHLQEENVEIMISSAWYKNDWSFEHWKNTCISMFKEDPYYFGMNLSYHLSIEEGLLSKARIEKIKKKDDFDEIGFMMEYESIPYGASDKAYFSLESLQACRKLLKPFSLFDEATIATGGKKVNKLKIPKTPDEKRIISLDVALSAGAGNDNSVFTFIRLIPDGDEYRRQIVNMVSLNGETSQKQALAFKRYYEDFEADLVSLDCLGIGMSIYDELIKLTRDDERDTEYPAWKAFNDDDLADRAASSALPVIFSVKGSLALNHDIAVKLRSSIENGKIELLVNDLEGVDYLEDKFGIDTMTLDAQAMLHAPFHQTNALINEMVNLEYEILNGKIRLKEKGRMRKDRYSSLAYGNLLASKLEEELKDTESDYDFGLFFN